MDDIKNLRKFAKFYGGKALTGSSEKQKRYGEFVRYEILKSNTLSDDDIINIVTFGSIFDKAEFWIDNKGKSPRLFDPKIVLKEVDELKILYQKHHYTLTHSGSTHKIEKAKKEIYESLCSLSLNIKFDVFPNCYFYDSFGKLKKGMKFRC